MDVLAIELFANALEPPRRYLADLVSRLGSEAVALDLEAMKVLTAGYSMTVRHIDGDQTLRLLIVRQVDPPEPALLQTCNAGLVLQERSPGRH